MSTYNLISIIENVMFTHLPTPPIGQDMTRSIFNHSLTGLNSVFLLLD